MWSLYPVCWLGCYSVNYIFLNYIFFYSWNNGWGWDKICSTWRIFLLRFFNSFYKMYCFLLQWISKNKSNVYHLLCFVLPFLTCLKIGILVAEIVETDTCRSKQRLHIWSFHENLSCDLYNCSHCYIFHARTCLKILHYNLQPISCIGKTSFNSHDQFKWWLESVVN